MLKKLAILILALPLFGCANKIINPFSTPPEPIAERTHKIFVGVPTFLSLEATSVRLDETWMLTASHNKPVIFYRDSITYHPYCDVALYKNPTDDPVEDLVITKPQNGTPITFAGYPLNYPLVEDQGEHLTNLNYAKYPDCLTALASSGVMVGMSGGGVWNIDTGDLVGIIHGWTWEQVKEHDGGGIYTPLYPLLDWIKETTGKDFSQKTTDSGHGN